MEHREEYRKLLLQIQETEKKIEHAKLKRNTISILCFSVVYFVIFYVQRRPEGWDVLGEVLAAVVIAGMHFLVNALVFTHLVHIGDSETQQLDRLKEKLSELSEKC